MLRSGDPRDKELEAEVAWGWYLTERPRWIEIETTSPLYDSVIAGVTIDPRRYNWSVYPATAVALIVIWQRYDVIYALPRDDVPLWDFVIHRLIDSLRYGVSTDEPELVRRLLSDLIPARSDYLKANPRDEEILRNWVVTHNVHINLHFRAALRPLRDYIDIAYRRYYLNGEGIKAYHLLSACPSPVAAIKAWLRGAGEMECYGLNRLLNRMSEMRARDINGVRIETLLRQVEGKLIEFDRERRHR